MQLNSALQLMNEILRIPGKKIVVLTIKGRAFKVDIDEQGIFGYQFGVKELFQAKLIAGLEVGGGMIIRQFLPIKIKRTIPNEKEIWIPEKKLYGVVLWNKKWFGLSREQLEDSYTTDAKTGSPIPQEEGVHYQNFPMQED